MELRDYLFWGDQVIWLVVVAMRPFAVSSLMLEC